MLSPAALQQEPGLGGLTKTRVCSPQDTLRRFEPLANVLGITRLADVTGLDRIGIPVFMACRPNSRSLSVFQGKGPTTDAARASALMEAIETFHAENISSNLLLTGYADMATARHVVDATRLPQSIDGVFSPDAKRLWIEGRDLTSHASVWVPYACVHCDYTTGPDVADACFLISTNGLASGNTLIEAQNHGLFELIERDATTLWNLQNSAHKNATELSLDTIDDPAPLRMIDQCVAAGLAIRVWDATTDIGVPVYVAELREAAESAGAMWSRPAWGSGCHHARDVALVRAVSEAAQARTTFIAGARDDMSWGDYVPNDSPDSFGSVQEQRARLDYRAQPRHDSVGVEEDLRLLLKRLTDAGFDEIVAVDLTKDGIDVPVVRMLVPGLEGPDDDFPRYVPGERARALSERMVL